MGREKVKIKKINRCETDGWTDRHLISQLHNNNNNKTKTYRPVSAIGYLLATHSTHTHKRAHCEECQAALGTKFLCWGREKTEREREG